MFHTCPQGHRHHGQHGRDAGEIRYQPGGHRRRENQAAHRGEEENRYPALPDAPSVRLHLLSRTTTLALLL